MANEFGYFIKSFTFIYFRSKNTVNILIKNWLDMCIGALVYWAVGFALTFGDSFGRILGTSYFFFYSMPGLKNFFLFLIITIIKKKIFFFFSLQTLEMVFPICVCGNGCNSSIWILSRTM